MERKATSGIILTLLIFSLLAANMIIVTAQETHDIAVVSVTPSSTLVEKGNVVNISVVVENQGSFTEIFNLNCTHDETLIDTQTNINLVSGESRNITFSWKVTLDPAFDFSSPFKIKAATSTVLGETDTEDNTLISSSRIRVFETTYVAVVPHSTVNSSLTIDTNYTVSIYTDYNGSDITAYQFSLTWNPNVLAGVSVVNDGILQDWWIPPPPLPPDPVPLHHFAPGTFDNTAGSLSTTFAYFVDAGDVASGPGILATVTFNVAGLGDSDITLGDNTLLIGWNQTAGLTYKIVSEYKPDFFHILHGFFQNKEVIHDVAVVSVTVSPTEVVQGEPVTITVVIENQGTVVEDVTVKVYYDYDPAVSFPFETRTVSGLAIGENTTENFTWDTTYVLVGTHTITAIVSGLLGETDTDDNTLRSDETVTVLLDAVYIRPNGSIDPPTAPISTVDNVTYTLTGNIVPIFVERDNIVVDGAGYSVQGRGRTGIYLYGRNNVTIKSMEVIAGFTGILLKNSSNNSVYGNNITNNVYGASLFNSSNNCISGNNITNNKSGINLFFSSSNTIFGNDISTNYDMGIFVIDSYGNMINRNVVRGNNNGVQLLESNENVITENTIENNNDGIVLVECNKNTLSKNTIVNSRRGIHLGLSDSNTISGNTIVGNNEYGIDGGESKNNSVFGNDLVGNNIGVFLSSTFAPNNTFFHNNFVDNTEQVHLGVSYPTSWDNGYPSGGNYWSDYEERYPDAEELDDSGIWDTSYVIDENNQDNYPLMEPWSPKPASPVEATQELIETIKTWNLSKGVENCLTSKLNNVIHQLDQGNEEGAIHKLRVFTKQVEISRGKKLTTEQANYLIAEAQRIIDLING